MKWYYNLKLAQKLLMGFIIVAVIAAIVGSIGLVGLSRISKADVMLYEENALGLDYAGHAAVTFQRMRFNTVKMMSANQCEIIDACTENLSEHYVTGSDFIKLYEDGVITDADRKLVDTLKPQWEQYYKMVEKAIALTQAGKSKEVEDFVFGDMAAAGDLLQGLFDDMMEYNSLGAAERSAENGRLASNATVLMIIVVLAGVGVAVLLGLFNANMISKPVKEMADASEKLALGDVNVHVETGLTDEIGQLAESFNKMIDNTREQAGYAERIAAGDYTADVHIKSEQDLLGKKFSEIIDKNNEMLTAIVAASDQVASGAQQVSDSSLALSQGAAEQASSVEQLTASLEEISSQTVQNAQNAEDANHRAEASRVLADNGNGQMKLMLQAMKEINVSSSNIQRVIKVIDDIAFQTNILALNAAVEAARAGQHGRGFAVVAEEVRNLAARSAEAAKETTEMIEGSMKKAEDGTKIAEVTADALLGIVNEIGQVADLVKGIATASNEQATGIGQINQGIMQVSQVVQTNSATSEESAAASEELTSQADLLKDMVGKFKLKDNRYVGNHEMQGSKNVKMLPIGR